MEGLRAKKYLQSPRKRFDPMALVFGGVGIVSVALSAGGTESITSFVDMRSLFVVVGGTLASMLLQFDFSSNVATLGVILRSFLGTPDREVLGILRQLDDAIMNDISITDLREGNELTGDLLGDIAYMYNQGLLFEEIDGFVTSRITDEYFKRNVAVSVLSRAAVIAPSFGLFGTVMGLVGVLKALSDPSQIGPSMSLALMTTAYGAGLGSLVFTPLAGRLEHHNAVCLEAHKQLMSKVGILLNREDRRLDRTINPEQDAA